MAVLLWTERTAHKKNVPFSRAVALLEIEIRERFFSFFVTSRAMDREENFGAFTHQGLRFLQLQFTNPREEIESNLRLNKRNKQLHHCFLLTEPTQ